MNSVQKIFNKDTSSVINILKIFEKPGVWTHTKFVKTITDVNGKEFEVICEPMQAKEIHVKLQHHDVIITPKKLYIEYFNGEPCVELNVNEEDFTNLKVESARMMFDEVKEVERWLKSL